MDLSILQGKTAAYCTLGCKLNFSETSSVGQTLKAAGVRTVRAGEQADICVVNTCSVTEVADRKDRQAIHRLTRQHPGACVIVTGCYAQLQPDEVLAVEGVDMVVGQNEKGRVAEFLAQWFQARQDGSTPQSTATVAPLWGRKAPKPVFVPSCSKGDRTRYWLKVQDGCDYFCSYCTIPYARGRSRNGSIASLVEQARQAADEGAKEIVITGVNIGDFGKTTGESFLDLVRALDGVEGISRYRISSLEPDLCDDELIDFVASSRAFMPHFHIPLQAGSDEVLRLMRRRYDTALFDHKIHLIKQRMPHAFIGVDVMVGARGETDELFEQSYRFLESLPVTQLHVFSYSERPGTAALSLPGKVAEGEKRLRSERLLALSDRKTEAFYAEHIGRTATVLLEHPKAGHPYQGFTDNYLRVEMTADDPQGKKAEKAFHDNTFVTVRLGDFNEDRTALKGEKSEK